MAKPKDFYLAAAVDTFIREQFLGKRVAVQASNYSKTRKPRKVVEIEDYDFAEFTDTPEWMFVFEDGKRLNVGIFDTVRLYEGN